MSRHFFANERISSSSFQTWNDNVGLVLEISETLKLSEFAICKINYFMDEMDEPHFPIPYFYR